MGWIELDWWCEMDWMKIMVNNVYWMFVPHRGRMWHVVVVAVVVVVVVVCCCCCFGVLFHTINRSRDHWHPPVGHSLRCPWDNAMNISLSLRETTIHPWPRVIVIVIIIFSGRKELPHNWIGSLLQCAGNPTGILSIGRDREMTSCIVVHHKRNNEKWADGGPFQNPCCHANKFPMIREHLHHHHNLSQEVVDHHHHNLSQEVVASISRHCRLWVVRVLVVVIILVVIVPTCVGCAIAKDERQCCCSPFGLNQKPCLLHFWMIWRMATSCCPVAVAESLSSSSLSSF